MSGVLGVSATEKEEEEEEEDERGGWPYVDEELSVNAENSDLPSVDFGNDGVNEDEEEEEEER